jgi:signal transduction histidine kinase
MQVLINLLKNAKEAMDKKNIDKKKIFITTESSEDSASISICDNAGGIKDEIIEKIFDPYFSTKSDKNGTGLGLYMSKTIVEKHLEGKIEVYNKDEGVCFVITLPLSI